jgi:hypothetical protein
VKQNIKSCENKMNYLYKNLKSTMIRFILIIILSMSCILVNAQSTRDLDEKNGFKKFKFGQSLNSLKSDIELYHFSDNLYKYNKSDPSELFGWSWEELQLGFHNDKLVYIAVEFRDDEYLFNSIKNSLEGVFGDGLVVGYPVLSDMGAKKSYQWIGDKVMMDITYLKIDGEYIIAENAISITVRVKDIDRIIAKGDF